MADLQIQASIHELARILYPDGYINAHTVQEFENSVQAILTENCFRILINCRDLQYINSSGLGVLMGVVEDIQENDGFLYLCNMNETVFSIFDTLGFTHLFRVFASEEEALQALNGN